METIITQKLSKKIKEVAQRCASSHQPTMKLTTSWMSWDPYPASFPGTVGFYPELINNLLRLRESVNCNTLPRHFVTYSRYTTIAV